MSCKQRLLRMLSSFRSLFLHHICQHFPPRLLQNVGGIEDIPSCLSLQCFSCCFVGLANSHRLLYGISLSISVSLLLRKGFSLYFTHSFPCSQPFLCFSDNTNGQSKLRHYVLVAHAPAICLCLSFCLARSLCSSVRKQASIHI